MKIKSPLLALLGLALAAPLFAAEPNTLTAKEKADGWKLLFDGKTLDGWRGYKTEQIGAGWKAENGALAMTVPKSGDLVTKDEFADFEFSFEWKIVEAGNSGVIYRSGFGETASYRTGPEYQVLDNQKAEDNKKANHLAGSLYDIGAAPAKDVTKPVGEWNEGKIVVRGWHVQHWLNGVKLVDQDLSTAEGKASLAASKFKDWPKFASLAKGHIALQEHGNAVYFRSLKIRELK
jgi:hypothetical protein